MSNSKNDIEAQKPIHSSSSSSSFSRSEKSSIDENEKKPPPELASIHGVFSFGHTRRKRWCLIIGFIFAVISGCAYPSIVFFFSAVFEDLSASPSASEDFLKNIREMSFYFLGIGAFTFLSMTIQNSCFEIAATEMTMSLKRSWFDALLRQDMAYFDIKDASGAATMISSSAATYKRGVGRKLAEGIQFFVTVLGALGYAFYSSWNVSLVILTVLPFMALSANFLVKMNQTQTTRANKSYAEAGSVVYETVSAIRTVLSLNSSELMIKRFNAATEKAYEAAARFVTIVGLSSGSVMGSFILSYLVLTLYGAYVLYDSVRDTGCDPSGAVPDNDKCDTSAMDVFGALMGVYFGAAGLPQITNAIEAFQSARAACHPALVAMNRKVGSDTTEQKPKRRNIIKGVDRRATLALPKYVIDSSSKDGKLPSSINGDIEFRHVSFAYPTRAETLVFEDLSVKLEAGKTVAFVGASGSGKSTIVQLIERFYDPIAGSVMLDGIDIKDLNVKWLREQIGLVSQEPVLFARSIRENIAYGHPDVTQEQIEEAAKMANAHDFIVSFPDGYDTHVGDKGAQLSGGQKQRIAIARVLVRNPKILLLDEATSALDSESELAVQKALDELLGSRGRTTIVIAHRLSTIRNADMIAVIADGKVVETGNHDELMGTEGSKYRQFVEAQSLPRTVANDSSSRQSSRQGSMREAENCGNGIDSPQLVMRNIHFCYPARPDNQIFQGLSLSVKKGETLALVGPSGSGKSSIIQLIERFYDPDSGNIELDGVDLKELNVKWLRDQLGLVSQEPTLFNTTIAQNIKYGCPDATQEQIEEAAKQANAHEFITSFPDGYNTEVGERGTQISGGQKQRIAIARAILKKPMILLLDEATSALDSESEHIVQEALDNLMSDKQLTTVVIAHRLSTVRNADRIAVIEDGKVREIGAHDELMSKPNGRYKRLHDYQFLDRHETEANQTDQETTAKKEGEIKEKDKFKVEFDEESIEDESMKKNAKRARLLAKDDIGLFLFGSVGAVLSGLVFPAWGILFAYMIELLYQPVQFCDPSQIPDSHSSCEEYFDSVADDMREMSIRMTYAWLGTIVCTLVGNMLVFYGFGTASERMNKRVRDAAFRSLVRQEVAFFDKRSVGSITSLLQDDAAVIHSFSGEPIRTLIMNLASVVIGIIVSFVYMWPFALLSMATLPFMSFGAEAEMKTYMGEDEGAEIQEDEHSPGGIVIETLLNIRTVASLTIEEVKSEEYAAALRDEDPAVFRGNLIKGLTTGLGFFVQCGCMALMFWWGGWLLYNYPRTYSFRDFLISMFALFLGLSGMAMAMQGTTNREKAKEAAKRIFYLIDRKSKIDPLSDEGKKDEKAAA